MSFFKLQKLNKPIFSKDLFILTFVLYACWLFTTYTGNFHSVYLHMWKYVFGTFSFENDIFLQRSNQPQISIIYSLFKYLKINPDNDYIGFTLHIFFSTISGFFLFKILKNFTPIKETNASLIIIFALLFIGGNSIVNQTYASWVIRFNGTPTYFGHQLIFVLLWLLLARKIFWLFIISSLMLLIAVKATWFTIGVGMLYSILFVKPIKKNYWIVGPLIVIGYLGSSGEMPLDYETNLLLFNSVLQRDNIETAFHLQPTINLIQLIISFPIYFLMLKNVEENAFKKLSLTVLVSSILCFVFGYIYALYGWKIWPEPRLLALSATRALGLYELFFWILFAFIIYKSNIYQIYKIAFLSFIFYLLALSVETTLFCLLILFFSFLIIQFYKNNNFLDLKNLILNKSSKFSYFSTLLFFLILAPGIMYLFVGNLKYVDLYALKKINKWTMGSMVHDNVRLDTALMLQKCDDFILLDLKHAMWSSAVAGKSQYTGGVFFNIFDEVVYKVTHFRQNISKNIVNNLNKKASMSSQAKEELLKTGVVLIVGDNEREFFPNDITSIDLKNSDTLLLFLDVNKKTNFLNNCKPFLAI